MFVIQIADVVDILKFFNCDSTVLTIDLISHYQVNKKVILIIKAKTSSKDYILKFYSDNVVDVKKENLQCEFSEFLFAEGIAVPHKYAVKGEYVIKFKIGYILFFVTVEDVFGEDIEIVSKDSAYQLGRILAEIHRISRQADYHLPTGIAFNSLYSPKVEYESVWKNISLPIGDEIKKTRELHNKSIVKLRQLWKELPAYAVHGDLALTSNLMYDEKKGYGIIDFNLSGDEILLGDLLITWYSSRYSESFIKQISSQNILNIRQAFFSGYFDVCQLHKLEVDIFEQSSKIINGLFFSKYVASKSVKNNADMVQLYAKVPENFDRFDFLDCVNTLIYE